MMAKLVLCIFYYRLIIGRWYRYSIFFTAALTIVCFGLTFFVNIFACHPISASWNLRLATGSNCVSRPPFYCESFTSMIFLNSHKSPTHVRQLQSLECTDIFV